MRIAMVSEHADPLADITGPDCGGQNVHVAELSAGLVRAGHDVTVYTRRDCDGPRDRIADAGYRVVRINVGPAQRIPKDDIYGHIDELIDGLTEEFGRWRPDVVHAHFWMSAVAAELAALPLRIPVAVTYHALGTVKRRFQGDADTSPRQRISLESVTGRRADAIAATSTDEVGLLAEMGVPSNHTTVIPCGVDVDSFALRFTTAASALPPRRQAHRIVTVGRLVPRKGFDTAIAALAAIPDTELLIAGGPSDGDVADDPEGRRLAAVARDYGVADRVLMLGAVPRAAMPELLQSADIVTCTPWYEPFGIVPLEAMAAGVPVIASAVGGLLDTVRPGSTGTHVPARDPGALAAAARALLDDPALRARFGRNGFECVSRNYRWSVVAAETERLYRRMTAAAAAREEPVSTHA